ncbi:hypothetical protein JCM1841_001038 [Sporobolomyces salmonicolor]
MHAGHTELPFHTYPFDAPSSRCHPNFGFRSPVDNPGVLCSPQPPYFPLTPATSPQGQQPPSAEPKEEEESKMLHRSVAVPSLPSFPPSLLSLLRLPTLATYSYASYSNSRRSLFVNHPISPRRPSFAADFFAFSLPSDPSCEPACPDFGPLPPPSALSSSSESARPAKGNSDSIAAAQPLPKNKICSTCGAAFARLNDLNRHIRIHTGEAPFRCRRCGIRFRRSDARKRHELKELC